MCIARSSELALSRSYEMKRSWMSWKEVSDKYGAEEAAARVRAGTIKAKRDEDDSRFWLFMVGSESSTDTMRTSKKARIDTQSKIDKNMAAKLSSSMDEVNLRDVENMWNASGEASTYLACKGFCSTA